jgi:iron complex transport system substrate-binding protein
MRGLAAALALCAATLAHAVDVMKDDLGREVAQVGAGKRIVALSPFITEAVFSIGAGFELVGVSEFSDYPPYARTITKVSGSAGVAWERLAAVRPDLVFAWKDSLRGGDLERFKELGIAVFVMAGRRLDDVPRAMRSAAWMLGRNPPDAIAAFEKRVADLRAQNAVKPRVTVLLEVQHRPLLTVAGEHFMNDALAVCGADNAFASLPGVAPEVSWELLMARNPMAIVGAGAPQNEQAFRDRWGEHATLSAVKNGAFVYVNGDHFFRPSPRLADGIEALCRGIDAVRKR